MTIEFNQTLGEMTEDEQEIYDALYNMAILCDKGKEKATHDAEQYIICRRGIKASTESMAKVVEDMS